MSEMIEPADFLAPFILLLEETFEAHHGIFLDANSSLFQTIASISAEQASIPVGNQCASLAAQVAHITFYIEVLERIVVKNDTSRADWGEVWRSVEQVSDADWSILQADLKHAYERISTLFRTNPVWNADSIGGALAVVVHSAYHLGEIRQALCILARKEKE